MARVTGPRRALIRARARGICEYCRLHDRLFQAGTTFWCDHIRPESHFAPSDPTRHHESNLAWACPLCNLYKSDQVTGVDPRDGVAQRLFNPRTDEWREHFVALPSGRIEGTTPVGRATVEALSLNGQSERVEARARHWVRREWPAWS